MADAASKGASKGSRRPRQPKAGRNRHALTRALAARFEKLGYEPYASEFNRYAVLLDLDRRGEIIELGRPLKGGRFFPTKALPRNIALLRQFETFARNRDTTDWRYWSIGSTGRKARIDGLSEDLNTFNRRINTVFSDCRKRDDFEVLLIAIHIRYDEATASFDLHAHFICQVPSGHREAVARRISGAFSKTHLPDKPIRKLAAAATYALWGVYKARDMVGWPATALSAVWELSKKRPRLVRAGGSFAKWRRKKKAKRSKEELAAARRKRENRAATRYKGSRKPQGDRILTKTTIRLGREHFDALIVEEYPRKQPSRAQDSPSATCAATQDTPVKPGFCHPPRGSVATGKPNAIPSEALKGLFWWTAMRSSVAPPLGPTPS